MKIASILLFICFTGGLLHADQVMELSIDQAIDLAIKNNTGYLISQQEVKQAKYRVGQNLGFLPQVSLTGYRVLNEKLMELEMPAMFPGEEPTKIALDFTKNYEFTIQVAQPVFTGGKIWFAFKNAGIDLKIAREKLKNSREGLILDVKKIFFNIQVMKEMLKTHDEAFTLAENNYRNVEESFGLGMVSKYDLLQAELSVSSIKPRILNITKLLNIMTSNLKIMLGIPEDTRLEVTGELSYDRKQLEQSLLIQQALVNRSELLQLKMELQKTENLLKMTWAQYVPDFSIVAQYNYRSDYFNFKADNWENYFSINLGINFPIFTGLRRSAQIGEMRVLKKILKLNLKELGDSTRIQVQDLVLSIKEEYENILMGLKNVETAKEGVRIAELSYKEGLISILELNTSYNALTQAKVLFLQAVYNYNIAISTLEKISGVTINGGME
jgi:outer membrane protein